MRTSNKLLSGLILTGLLLIAGLFIFVRVQVARGAVVTGAVTTGSDNYWADVHKIDGPVRSVSINGLKNIILVPASEARLEIDKNVMKKVIWKLDNGVLTVMSDTSNKNDDYVNHTHVELFLPATDSISVQSSDIDVKNTGDSTTAAAFNFILSKSKVVIRHDNRSPESKPVTYYHSLQVDARNGSEVTLEDGIAVDKFSVKLRKSVLDADNFNLRFNDKPVIQTDDVSRVRLSGQHLRQAIITSTE